MPSVEVTALKAHTKSYVLLSPITPTDFTGSNAANACQIFLYKPFIGIRSFLSIEFGFLYLKVFDSIRHLINMIIGITNSIFTILLVMIYVMIAIAVLLT